MRTPFDTHGGLVRVAGRRRRFYACLAIAACAIAATVSLPSHALAADDDDEESIETKFIKGLLGISDRDSINYRERPPLVVPPNLSRLPAPETNAAVNSPAWPKDPEIVERKKLQQAKKNERRKTFEEESRPLSPAELELGRKAGAGRTPTPTGPQDAETDSWRTRRPDELGYKGGLFNSLIKDNSKPEVATFSGEPARSDLTQPPPGYRTPSPSHPYGLSPKKEKAKPYDYVNKRGTEN